MQATGLKALFELSDGDAGTYQTLALMKHQVDIGVHNPFFRELAENILRYIPAMSDVEEVGGIYQYVKEHTRFTRDIWDIETLKTPERIFEEIHETGVAMVDCDDIAVFTAVLLRAVGYRTRFCVITTPLNQANTYDHVYCDVFLNSAGDWYPVDASTNILSFGEIPPFKRIYTYE